MTDWTKATEKECRAWCKAHNYRVDIDNLHPRLPDAWRWDTTVYPRTLEGLSITELKTDGTKLQALRIACAAAEVWEAGK